MRGGAIGPSGWRIWLLLVFLCLPLSVTAAISVVGTTTNSGGSSADNSLTLTRPAGVVFGDLLLAQVATNPSSASISPPTGWIAIDQGTQGSVRQRIFYRIANDSEPANYTFSFSASARTAGGIIALRGAELIPPIFAAYSERTGSASTLVADEVNSSRVGSQLVAFFAQANGGATLSSSPAPSYTNNTGAGPNGVSVLASQETLSTVGPTGTRTATSSNNTSYVSQMIAIRPAVQTCFIDDFNRTTGLGSDWSATVRQGSFIPDVVGNRLQMTQAVGNQSTAATLNRLFPAEGNLVTVEFDHFAYGGNGADGVVFVLSDSAVTPQPGGFGGSLGYANRCGISGFAGGWVGVGLDEFGNYSNPSECRNGGPGSRVDAVAVRGSSPNYNYMAGTNALNPGIDQSGNTPAPGLRYRLTVDSRVSGEAWVSVERSTTAGGSTYATLISRFNALAPAFGQGAVPESFYFSLAGGTGGSHNIHALDNLNICALDMRSATSQIDHFRFYHDGSGSTCGAENVRLLACADASCSTLFTGSVTLTLSSSGAQWQDASGNALSGNSTTFSGGSVNLRLARSTAGTEALNVVSSTPSTRPLSVPSCFNSSTNAQFPNCNLVFSGSNTFTFGVAPANVIPNQEAGVESLAIRIKANNAACGGVPSAFQNQTQSVQFYFSYLDPLQTVVNALLPTASERPLLYIDPYANTANTDQTFFALGTALSGATARQVYFNSQGEGYFRLLYPDVGQIQLSAAVTAQNISGAGAFVVKPYEFAVSDVKRTADNASNPAAADATGSVFIAAGEDFTATVTARNAPHKLTDGSGSAVLNPVLTTPYGRTTKLFGKEGTPEGVRLTSDATQLQPAGGNNPALARPAASPGRPDNSPDILGSEFGTGAALGIATVTDVSWPEVGIIRLQPKIRPVGSETAGDYLGAGDVTRYTSPNIGRFIPYEFGVSGAVLTNRQAAACVPASGFTYLDEGLGLGFTLQALAKSGAVTKNYAGDFAKLALQDKATELNLAAVNAAATSTVLTARLAVAAPAASWPAVGDAAAGQVIRQATVTVSSLTAPGNNRMAPDGPFSSVRFGIAPVDADSVRIRIYDLDADAAAGNDHKQLGVATQLYFGTLRLVPAISSELLPLTMPAELLRWNGTAFVPNGDDSCTRLPVVRLNLGNWTKNLAFGETAVSNAGALAFNGGRASIRLSAPGAGNDGTVDVTADLTGAGLGYLNTRRAGSAAYNQPPSATAAFGLYKGANQIIHLREIY